MALQGLNYIVPLVTLPYLVRVLGIGPFGLISVAQAFATYFVIFTDYGFNLSATRRIALQHDDMAAVSGIFSAVITIKIILMLFGLGVMAIVLVVVPHFRPDADIYAVSYMAVIGGVLLPTWLFQGLQDMRTIAVLNGVTKLASACLLFVFVHSSRLPGRCRLAAAGRLGLGHGRALDMLPTVAPPLQAPNLPADTRTTGGRVPPFCVHGIYYSLHQYQRISRWPPRRQRAGRILQHW
jgi:hypothetical protein